MLSAVNHDQVLGRAVIFLRFFIDRSIAELQNGTMRILTDGDLFKARLSFPILSADTAKNQ